MSVGLKLAVARLPANGLLVVSQESVPILMQRQIGRFLQPLDGIQIVVEFDERSQTRGFLHLGEIHPHRPFHRVCNDHVLQALPVSFTNDHKSFLGGNMAGGKHQSIVGDQRDDFIDFR